MYRSDVDKMRQIKFRFRIENIECPVSKSYFEYRTLEELVVSGFSLSDIDYEIKGKDQFTGLLDKNGKDIYEGDVVGNKQVSLEVFFEDGSYRVGHNTDLRLREFNEDCEVVGNIYDNPELLK
jgi:hypothetical protein